MWADANRVLPPGSAEPGRYRSVRTPYTVPIARAFSLWFVLRVIFVMARQMAKTNGVIFNVLGQRFDDSPAPCIYVGPTESNIDKVIEPKIQHMLEHTPSLRAKAAKGQENKKHAKIIAGVPLRLAWAGSDTQLKADSMALGFVDEVDGIEAERKSAGEGTVVDMVEAITKSYPDGRIGITSTPTAGLVKERADPRTGLSHWEVSEDVTSAVWVYWQEGSRHEWSWPCPHCRVYFIPRSSLLTHTDGVSPEEAEAHAAIACPHCGSAIGDGHRTWMNRRGVMVAPGQRPDDYEDSWGALGITGSPGCVVRDYGEGDNPAPVRLPWGNFKLSPATSKTYLSFWASGLATFSIKTTYGYIAAKLVRARQSGLPQRVQAVYNTDLGEPFLVSGDAPDWRDLETLRDTSYIVYQSWDIPAQVTTLTAGVDVQGNRLVFVVRGWVPQRSLESYLIAAGEMWGETDQIEVWERLADELLYRDFGGGLHISKMVVDAGYRKEAVYGFCLKHKPVAVPGLGRDTMDQHYRATWVEVSATGRTKKFGLQAWHLNTDVGKSWVHARMRWPEDQPGRWLLPQDVTTAYMKQVTAESRLLNEAGKVEWVKIRADNHFLDCESMAYFAMRLTHIKPTRPQLDKDAQTKRHAAPIQPLVSEDPWLT